MAVKTYSAAKDGAKQLSEHYAVREFRCKDGSDEILINDALPPVLEYFFEIPDVDVINVNSGYRTPSHSVAVGGYATDQHTKGNAADVSGRYKDGSRIPASVLLTWLENKGHMGGIGKIDNYSVHVDVRGEKCWFDETNGSRLVNSWYDYLGIKRPADPSSGTKPTVSGKAPTIPGARTGVDIYHGDVIDDFNKLRAAGVEFAILQAGFGRFIEQKDTKFEQYYSAARAAGMQVGAYWYSYAVTPEQARMEARICLETIRGKKFEYPIYYDVEEQKQFATGKANVSAMIEAFLSTVQEAGYFVGLYMSRGYLEQYVTDEIQKKYTLWVAEYGVKKSGYKGPGKVDIWQPDAVRGIDGVRGEIDIDYAYREFPAEIKAAGLNGFALASGDVNGDGKVNSSDARKVLRAAAKLEELNDAQKKAADADGDGRVTSADARAILRKAGKLE